MVHKVPTELLSIIKGTGFRTKQAMQGNMTFQQSLNVRLNIIRPSRTQVKEFLEAHPPKLTPGIKYTYLILLNLIVVQISP